MIREFICVVCPRGCRVNVSGEGDRVNEVKGNHCARGAKYAKEEFIDPRRTLTTSVLAYGGGRRMLPVRSSAAVPRDRLRELMEEVEKVKVNAPVALHQVIIKNIGNTGVDMIASMPLSEA